MFGLWNSIIITRMRKIHSVIYIQLSNCQYGSVTCEKEVSNNSAATLQFNLIICYKNFERDKLFFLFWVDEFI